jgi:hypothetical protein
MLRCALCILQDRDTPVAGHAEKKDSRSCTNAQTPPNPPTLSSPTVHSSFPLQARCRALLRPTPGSL